jgi:plasmid stability protein
MANRAPGGVTTNVIIVAEATDVATLYLRGVPEKVARELRAAAARKGTTLARLTTGILRAALGLEDDGNAEETSPLQADMKWFAANRAQLLKRFPEQYIAIVNGQVIDHDTDFSALATRIFGRLGSRPVFMPKCEARKRTVHLRSPRRVKTG